LALRPALNSAKSEHLQFVQKKEAKTNKIEILSDKINIELNLIGISSRLKGRKIIYDALMYLLQEENDLEMVYNFLVDKYKRANSSICRTMQTAIYNAWRSSPIEEIELHYAAKYSHERGVPTPTEFLFYYKDKISRSLK